MRINKKSSKSFNKKLFPLMLIMIVPLFMFAQNVVYDTKFTNPYLILRDSYMDLFNFYKSIALYIVTAMAILFYFLYTKRRDMELSRDKVKYYIPAVIYTLFIILSMIFSIYPKVALFGVYERFEGGIALICYIVMMIYAIEIIRNETDLKYVMKAFIVMCFAVAAIGVLQGLNLDPLKTRLAQILIGLPKEIDVVTNFGSSSYSTLYNPNNAGQFAAMTAPVLLGLFFALRDNKWKIFTGITTVLMFVIVITSKSANSLFGIVPAILLFALLFIKHLIPKSKKGKLIVIAAMALLLVASVAMSGKIYRYVINSATVRNEIKSFKPDEDDMYLHDIIVEEDNIQFVTNVGIFNLAYMDTGMAMLDDRRYPLRFEQKDTEIVFLDEPYDEMLGITIDTTNTMTVSFKRAGDRARVEVVFDDEKFLGIRGTGGRIVHDVMDNQMPEKLQGLETTFSRRGYLWFVTLSRLDEVIFVGAGPDNFLYWFEQHDLIGKINLNHRAQILADKPHNLFLQIASQTGVLSLLAFMTLIGMYYVRTLRKIGLRRKESFYEITAAGIICGITGFLASSMFVDSSVGVTTVFYILLGMGIVIEGNISPIIKEKKRRKNPKSTKV